MSIWHFKCIDGLFSSGRQVHLTLKLYCFLNATYNNNVEGDEQRLEQPTGLLPELHPPYLSISILVRMWKLWKADASGSLSPAGSDGIMRLLHWCRVWPPVQRKGRENAKRCELKNETMYNICMQLRAEGCVRLCVKKKEKEKC